MHQPTTNVALATIFVLFVVIFALAIAVFSVLIYWRIFSKAGYSGVLGLFMFVPIANVIVLCILAFGEWPIYRELRQMRQQVGMVEAPGR